MFSASLLACVYMFDMRYIFTWYDYYLLQRLLLLQKPDSQSSFPYNDLIRPFFHKHFEPFPSS